MKGMVWGKRGFISVAACGVMLAVAGCGSHEVQLPVVKEESLSDEQKAQLERVRNAQAEAFRRAGVDPQVAVTPADIAQQRLEAEQMNQTAPDAAQTPDTESP